MWNCYNHFPSLTLHLRIADIFLKPNSDLLIIKEFFLLHIWRAICFISSFFRVVTCSWKRNIVAAVMGVVSQRGSHNKKRKRQLWEPSEVTNGSGIGNTASLESVWCAPSVLGVSAPFLLNSFWLGNRVKFLYGKWHAIILLYSCFLGPHGKTTPPWLDLGISKETRQVCLSVLSR